jgi:hypothetical protein
MASESLLNMNQGTASLIQGSSQYTVGLFSGLLIDWTFVHLTPEPHNIPLRLLKLLSQAGLNGLLLSYLIPWLHPTGIDTYRDPTGGYLLAFGLLHGQPTFYREAKELTTSILEVYEEVVLQKPSEDETTVTIKT